MKKFFTLYRTTNNIDGKIYIGIHKTNDLDDGYMGSGKYLKRAINKYGIENFTKEIIKICLTEEEMFDWESLTVTKDFVKRKDTYNICEGGEGGFSYINNSELNLYGNNRENFFICCRKGKERQKELMKDDSIYRKKRNELSKRNLERYREKNGSWWKGKKHTKETKQKISRANSVNQKGKNNNQYGTCWIYNIEFKQNKKIKKEELNSWIEQGWCKGRKMKF